LGGTVVGLSYYLSVLYFVDSSVLAASPPQWPLVFAGSFAGLVGSLVDSILGATLQYSGMGSVPVHSLEYIYASLFEARLLCILSCKWT